ncbi:GNAT family N-acetyltransferase [Terrabacter sp. C0L_2]|jgi:predicted GNAT family acetyltransferase|uniref:GNAT family N-acetyltransferase n=1 Tax=Terrabacter sp. C0L_2 TaxID=3108389 RepID=UPI002ED05D5A|nr:GNAT family N-acetyltransferase [Terrabacter sp. C0L_2]
MTEHTGEGGTGADSIEVVDAPGRGRFELRDGDRVIGVASYAIVPAGTVGDRERIVLFHTEVRPEYEGRGLAARLATHALDAAIGAGRDVVALCPYVKAYVQRHPEPYAAHVVPATQADVDAAERSA